MATQIQLRRGTAAEWTATNPILAQGEQGFEIDTNNIKVGNGTSSWSTLEYLVVEGASTIHTHDDRYYTESETNALLVNKLSTSTRNAVNGVAGLDATSKIAASALPSTAVTSASGLVIELVTVAPAPGAQVAGTLYFVVPT